MTKRYNQLNGSRLDIPTPRFNQLNGTPIRENTMNEGHITCAVGDCLTTTSDTYCKKHTMVTKEESDTPLFSCSSMVKPEHRLLWRSIQGPRMHLSDFDPAGTVPVDTVLKALDRIMEELHNLKTEEIPPTNQPFDT